MDAADILLFDPLAQSLNFAAGRGFKTNQFEHTKILLGDGEAGAAALEQRTLQVPNLSQAPPWLLRTDLFMNEGFGSFFVTPLLAKGEIKGVLEVFHRAIFTPDAEWLSFFEALAGQAAIAIDSAQLFDNLQRSNQQLLLAYNATIEGWSRALDLRDHETEGHTQRVTQMTLRLAQVIGHPFSDEDFLQIRRGALLHDIGKMGVPDNILLKPDDLNEEEQVIMRRHPEYAYHLLYPIVYLRKALDIPYYHHERWDGSGYPLGLKGEQIPLAARIFAVVDVWDALRSTRPYRHGWPDEKVYAYLRDQAGSAFDPQIVDAFLQMMEISQ
jgi:HD-GYP domain-containing protein (c-di-GMP phosphodiesterase class II)